MFVSLNSTVGHINTAQNKFLTTVHWSQILEPSSKLFLGCKKVKDFVINNELIRFRGRCGFSTSCSSELGIYAGIMSKNAGKSTEFGGIGGRIVRGALNEPLSSSGVHDCALLNLVDEKTQKQVLLHVFPTTSEATLKKFMQEDFSSFTGVNILPGDNFNTAKTVKKILSAIKSVNEDTPVKFYHLNSENAEIVAHQGALTSILHQNSPKPTFNIVQEVFY